MTMAVAVMPETFVLLFFSILGDRDDHLEHAHEDGCRNGVDHHCDQRAPLDPQSIRDGRGKNSPERCDERGRESVHDGHQPVHRVGSEEDEDEADDEKRFQKIEEEIEKRKRGGAVALHGHREMGKDTSDDGVVHFL